MANTEFLDLIPLDGANKLKNFPTPYNGNLGKVDGFAKDLYKGTYYGTPCTDPGNGLYFTVVTLRRPVADTNYTVTIGSSAEGGYAVDPQDFTVNKYLYGFRAYTSVAGYNGKILNFTVS